MPRSPTTRSESKRLVRSGAKACRIPFSSAPCSTIWQGGQSSVRSRGDGIASSERGAAAAPPGR
uniref:Uncharacterized protein n=1 Tax=Human herpesvirus 2 TaxID=10310 RepID=A0A481T6I0_HHV2|nr:hypothetical protein [Human alphaherpesvirus 2]QBH78421.1 hypothetical protein [Human alphaherpesvirus 2]QBH80155.1 hypothetical protein [Human alphaherpesvirus 2]QBH82841.1 hypothetical protein [Human alphaherpesvirus 2]QBH85193.1 hypothetical protein [Human alphaherpesvirus 2]